MLKRIRRDKAIARLTQLFGTDFRENNKAKR